MNAGTGRAITQVLSEKANTNKKATVHPSDHFPRGIRTDDPTVREIGDGVCFRPRDLCEGAI